MNTSPKPISDFIASVQSSDVHHGYHNGADGNSDELVEHSRTQHCVLTNTQFILEETI